MNDAVECGQPSRGIGEINPRLTRTQPDLADLGRLGSLRGLDGCSRLRLCGVALREVGKVLLEADPLHRHAISRKREGRWARDWIILNPDRHTRVWEAPGGTSLGLGGGHPRALGVRSGSMIGRFT